LPKHLQQGEIFSKPGEFPIVARYSTEPGDPGLDVRCILPYSDIESDLLVGPHSRPSRLCHEALRC
jgi:hypothetical protein